MYVYTYTPMYAYTYTYIHPLGKSTSSQRLQSSSSHHLNFNSETPTRLGGVFVHGRQEHGVQVLLSGPCMYIHIHMHTLVCIYTYKYTPLYAYTYTYIHPLGKTTGLLSGFVALKDALQVWLLHMEFELLPCRSCMYILIHSYNLSVRQLES